MQSRPMTKRKRKHLNTEATERGACHVVPPRHTTTECGRPFQQMDSRRSGTERTTHRHRHESPKQKLYPSTSTANRRSTARTLSTTTARTLSTSAAYDSNSSLSGSQQLESNVTPPTRCSTGTAGSCDSTHGRYRPLTGSYAKVTIPPIPRCLNFTLSTYTRVTPTPCHVPPQYHNPPY